MSARASRRQVLAHIALADVPTPNSITFIDAADVISIKLDRLADLRPWADLTGIPTDQTGRALANASTYTQDHKTRRLVALYPTWLGWNISLLASEPVDASPVEPLDDTTREQLAAIADSSAAHRHVAGSGGAPGQCSAECSCGVVFDGFDTIAEAGALLDDHIATEAGASC